MKKNFDFTLKILLYFFYFPFSLATFLSIRLISPIKTIRFGMINSHRIGHFALEWEIFYQLMKKGFLNVHLISFHGKVSNEFLAKMIKRKLIILPSKFIYLILIFNKSFLGHKNHFFYFHDYKHDLHNKLSNFKPSLNFTKKEKILGKKIIKNLKNKKIVCLIARDGKYLSKEYSINDYNNSRNSKINDYIPAIKALEKKGYTIFRMGKEAEQKLTYKSPSVIDYPFSSIKSDFLDLFLIKNCEFLISTGCGLDSIALIFNKPILYLNYVPVGVIPVIRNKSIFSFKKHFNFKKKKYFSLSEIFKKKLAYKYFKNKELREKGIIFKSATKKELKDIVLEMMKLYKKQKKLSKIQMKFKKKYKKLSLEYPPEFKMFGKIYPTVSNMFIKKNKLFLK